MFTFIDLDNFIALWFRLGQSVVCGVNSVFNFFLISEKKACAEWFLIFTYLMLITLSRAVFCLIKKPGTSKYICKRQQKSQHLSLWMQSSMLPKYDTFGDDSMYIMNINSNSSTFSQVFKRFTWVYSEGIYTPCTLIICTAVNVKLYVHPEIAQANQSSFVFKIKNMHKLHTKHRFHRPNVEKAVESG